MRSGPKLHPLVEDLESLTLLSGLPTIAAAVAELQPLVTSPRPKTVKLSGTVKGTYEDIGAIVRDQGLTFHFSGQGKVEPQGTVSLGGALREVGLIAGGRASGTLTLTTSQGSVTLTLTGPKQNGPASLPNHFSFKITAATGAYSRDVGHGTAVLTLKAGTEVVDGGTFQLVFKA
jgi:hypothetical protein